jgi:hypothetical protein
MPRLHCVGGFGLDGVNADTRSHMLDHTTKTEKEKNVNKIFLSEQTRERESESERRVEKP